MRNVPELRAAAIKRATPMGIHSEWLLAQRALAGQRCIDCELDMRRVKRCDVAELDLWIIDESIKGFGLSRSWQLSPSPAGSIALSA